MNGFLLSRFETYLLDEEVVEGEVPSTEVEEQKEYLQAEQPHYPQGFFSSL